MDSGLVQLGIDINGGNVAAVGADIAFAGFVGAFGLPRCIGEGGKGQTAGGTLDAEPGITGGGAQNDGVHFGGDFGEAFGVGGELEEGSDDGAGEDLRSHITVRGPATVEQVGVEDEPFLVAVVTQVAQHEGGFVVALAIGERDAAVLGLGH